MDESKFSALFPPLSELSAGQEERAENEGQPQADFRGGFVALVGRPSAGKSTLVNALCGHKVAIVSPKPQTTRNVIRGIVHRKNCQLVLLDTPGFAKTEDGPKGGLRGQLRQELYNALRQAEAVLYLCDLSRAPLEHDNGEAGETREEQGLLAVLREALGAQPRPFVLAMNKADLLPENVLLSQRVADYLNLVRQYFPQYLCQNQIRQAQQNTEPHYFVVSAKKRQGLEELLECLSYKLPAAFSPSLSFLGGALYEANIYTDQEPQFRIQELIREQALAFCGKELPYALYVKVADLEYRRDALPGECGLWVRAFLQVERESQKGILVGKGGQRVREIRKRSTRAVRKEFGCPVRLELRVKVDYKWRRKNF